MKYIFGPVPSRRLGFSLGVDIIPFKTCTFDCIYCELGKTTQKTIGPTDSIRPEAVLAELEGFISSTPVTIDHITLSGSGEPTLHPDLDLIIKEIKKMVSVPVSVITNGSLLYKEEVLARVLEADIVVPSLDASDPETYKAVNRPHPSLHFDQLIQGLTGLGRCRGPRIWLEILFIKGINDGPAQIAQFGPLLEKINPEKIQLNTVVRPPVEGYAEPLSYARLKEIQKVWGPRAEIITGTSREPVQPVGAVFKSEIRAMVARRPCTAEDIGQCLGLPLEDTVRFLSELIRDKKVIYEFFDHQGFYRGI